MRNDSENPYRAPRVDELAADHVLDRQAALMHVRVALLVLAIPTVCNWAALFVHRADPTDDLDGLRLLLGIVNAVGLMFLFPILWFLTLPLCEVIAKITYWFCGRGVSQTAWVGALYQSLRRVPRAAVAGAVGWLVWLRLFFFAGHSGGFGLDVSFQLAGHLIAAWVYVPLLYRWYLLRKLYSTADSSVA